MENEVPNSSRIHGKDTICQDISDNSQDGDLENCMTDRTQLSYDKRDLPDDSTSSFLISTLASLLIAGLGSIFSGWLINWAQNKEFLKEIPDALMLVTPLLGLKGNLEMTFASKLGTLSNTGEIDDCLMVRRLIKRYIPFLQVQSILFSLLLAVLCVVVAAAFDEKGKLSTQSALIIIASAIATASISSFIIEMFLIALVFTLSHFFGIDSDNFATPVAASCGDFGTFLLFMGFGTLQLKSDQGDDLWPTVTILLFFVLYILPMMVYMNFKSKQWNSGWWAIIVAMVLSGAGGWILKYAVNTLKWTTFSTFQPLIAGTGLTMVHGLAGNRISVQSSRISTSLVRSRAPIGTIPYGTLREKFNPCSTFCGSGVHTKMSRLLVMTTIPAQLLFLFITIWLNSEIDYNNSLVWFILSYLAAGLIQMIVLLYFCQCIVYLLWKIGCDPDSSAIPLLTSFSDLIGSVLLLGVYLIAKPSHPPLHYVDKALCWEWKLRELLLAFLISYTQVVMCVYISPRVKSRSYTYTIKRPKQEREPERYKHFEDVLDHIHPFGVYQIFTCLCIIFAQIEWTGNLSFINFVGLAEPDWECQMPGGGLIRVNASLNSTVKCDTLKKCSNFTAIKNSTNFHSILAQFKMICDDSDKPRNIQLILASGLLLGSIIGGHIGDWFGRQFLFYMSQLFIVISSCLTIASRTWVEYSIYQVVNSVLYGVIEVETLTLMMEYTNNKFRMIPNACFQSNIANMVIALIALTTKDWQLFFVFLNFVSTPIIMAFMLFHESPRWLLATGRTNDACNVLNDISNKRWNGTEAVFNSKNLDEIPAEKEVRWPNFYHLFYKPRFAKQSIMQILSMFTYSLIASCYLYVMKDLHDNAILVVFLDGVFRVIIPVLIIIADIKFIGFTRRLQFLSSLTLVGACFIAVIVLVATGVSYKATSVSVLIIIAAMINDSAFWMNIVQVTTQRYPTVLRCVAFGCLHGIKHIGTIVGVLIIPKLLDNHPIWVFIIPAILIVVTLVMGFFMQPDTKGKALLDTLEEVDYTRVESALPMALFHMATMHRVMQGEMHTKIVEENKEKWAEWQKQLDEKEEQERNTSQGNYNYGADLSDEDESQSKTVNFLPRHRNS